MTGKLHKAESVLCKLTAIKLRPLFDTLIIISNNRTEKDKEPRQESARVIRYHIDTVGVF